MGSHPNRTSSSSSPSPRRHRYRSSRSSSSSSASSASSISSKLSKSKGKSPHQRRSSSLRNPSRSRSRESSINTSNNKRRRRRSRSTSSNNRQAKSRSGSRCRSRSRSTSMKKSRSKSKSRSNMKNHSSNNAKETKTETPSITANVLRKDQQRGRTGGIYIPPFKLEQLRRQQEQAMLSATKEDKYKSVEYQRSTWDALRKSLNGLINKVNVSNIKNIIPELFHENLVRGRGIFARSMMKAQLASPGFSHIYAAVVAVINTKLPQLGELIVKRCIIRLKRALTRGDKVVALALIRFLAQLINQEVIHELVALEIITYLLSTPTDDSVEIAVHFTKEVGEKLQENIPQGLDAIFDRYRSILHENTLDVDKRVQYTIEGLFSIRKNRFKDYPAIYEPLDLVESSEQIQHEFSLLDNTLEAEESLDIFRYDPEYEKNDKVWKMIRCEILGEEEEEDDEDDTDESEDESNENQMVEVQNSKENSNQDTMIYDYTEQDLINLRRTIYLTIMSSVSHEECAHKLLQIEIKPGQEKEICNMLIECCCQERTYLRYYGLLGQRFSLLKIDYQMGFDECFSAQYATIHRLETNKLRNLAKFYAYLLYTDSMPWTILEYIHLNEEETTSSSRIFIKILVQELNEHFGITKLKQRFEDPAIDEVIKGMFPMEIPRNMRFAINFYTSIGLSGLTDGMRKRLKELPKAIMKQKEEENKSDEASSDSDSESASDSGRSTSSSDSDSSGSESDSDSDSESSSSSESSISRSSRPSGDVAKDIVNGEATGRERRSLDRVNNDRRSESRRRNSNSRMRGQLDLRSINRASADRIKNTSRSAPRSRSRSRDRGRSKERSNMEDRRNIYDHGRYAQRTQNRKRSRSRNADDSRSATRRRFSRSRSRSRSRSKSRSRSRSGNRSRNHYFDRPYGRQERTSRRSISDSESDSDH